MKNQTFTGWQAGRRILLGAVIAASVLAATDRGGAASGPVGVERIQGSQANAQRGQAPPSRQDGQKPSNPPRIPWWKDPVVIKELKLTPDQTQKIDAAWKKREVDMAGPAKEYKKQQDELDRLVKERKVEPAVIALQVDRVEAQRTTLNKSWTVMIYQFSLILTPEQNVALKAYRDRIRRERK